MRIWLKTALYLVGSLILTRLVPFSSFFRNLDTMCHEFSHAAVALLLSGRVHSIELHADHSGVTYFSAASGWSLLPIGLAGYIGASLFSLLLFYWYRRDRLKLGIGIVTAIALAMLLLFVHSGFGAGWLTGFVALNAIVLLFARGWPLRFYYLLIAFLSLEESTFSPIGLTLLSIAKPSQAGDASSLADVTGIPSLVWALLFSLAALFCASRSVRLFSGGRSGRAAPISSYGGREAGRDI